MLNIASRPAEFPATAEADESDARSPESLRARPTGSVLARRRTRSRSPTPEHAPIEPPSTNVDARDRRPPRLSRSSIPYTVVDEATISAQHSRRLSQDNGRNLHGVGHRAPVVPDTIALPGGSRSGSFSSQEPEEDQIVGSAGQVNLVSAISSGAQDDSAIVDEEGNQEDTELTLATKELLDDPARDIDIAALPILDAVTFSRQSNNIYLPIRLHVVTSKDGEAFVYFKATANRKKAPTMHVMLKQTGGDRLVVADFAQIHELIEEAARYLNLTFSRIWNKEEFRATAKYYFILAAEAQVLGFTDLLFPLNDSFEITLRRVCERLRSNLPDIDPNADLSGNIESPLVHRASMRQFVPNIGSDAVGSAGHENDRDDGHVPSDAEPNSPSPRAHSSRYGGTSGANSARPRPALIETLAGTKPTTPRRRRPRQGRHPARAPSPPTYSMFPGAPKNFVDEHDRLRRLKKDKTTAIVKRRATAQAHLDKVKRLQQKLEKHMVKFKQIQKKVEQGGDEVNDIDDQLEEGYKELLQHVLKNQKSEDAEEDQEQ
jgi:uncharacterized protein YukE